MYRFGVVTWYAVNICTILRYVQSLARAYADSRHEETNSDYGALSGYRISVICPLAPRTGSYDT